MYCKKCGAEYQEGMSFCKKCGARLNDASSENMGAYGWNGNGNQPGAYGGYPPAPMCQFDENHIPEEYRPISMWGYFGYSILFGIPLVGFICTIVYACGGTKNKNLQNFAKSRFCGLIISIGLIAFVVLWALAFGISYRL